jgi:H+/gluconate symporter-like permease
MSDPYQAPHARLEGDHATPSIGGKVLKAIAYALTASVSFVLGCVVTLLAMFRAFAPPVNCPSPCDGPAYAAIGATMFVGPVVGLLFAFGGVYLLSWLLRRKARAAA